MLPKHVLEDPRLPNQTPNSVFAVSTNELMSGIRCVRLGRHRKGAGQGVIQDRFGKHCIRRILHTTSPNRSVTCLFDAYARSLKTQHVQYVSMKLRCVKVLERRDRDCV